MKTTTVDLRKGGRGQARTCREIATRSLSAARLCAADGGSRNPGQLLGICVVAGLAASDAICLSARGHRYVGGDHSESVRLLRTVDPDLADELERLVARRRSEKPLRDKHLDSALRSADRLVAAAGRHLA